MTRKPVAFTIDAAQLGSALARLAKIVDGKSHLATLHHLLFDVGSDKLEITGSDLDQWACIKLSQVDDLRPGHMTLPARELISFVKGLPAGAALTVELSGGPGTRAKLSAGKIECKLSTLDPADYPAMPEIGQDVGCIVLEPETWLRMSAMVAHCMGNDEETRRYLWGVHLHTPLVNGHGVRELRLCATDGKQLARITADAPMGADTFPSVIVPRQAVNALRGILANEPDLAEIAASESLLRITTPTLVYVSRLLDGTFPEVDRVIPPPKAPIMIPVKLLDGALARAQMFAETDSRAGRVVAIDLDEGGIKVTAGPAFEPLFVERVETPLVLDGARRFGIPISQLRSVLSLIQDADVELDAPDELSPIRLTDPANASAVFVVMPMRV